MRKYVIIIIGASIVYDSELEVFIVYLALELICSDLCKNKELILDYLCINSNSRAYFSFLGFGSSKQILATNGVGHTTEARFMMVMGMLCRLLTTQACMLLHMGLTLFMATTNNR